MAKNEQEPSDIPTGARMADLGSAKLSAITHSLTGKNQDQTGTDSSVHPADVEALVAD